MTLVAPPDVETGGGGGGDGNESADEEPDTDVPAFVFGVVCLLVIAVVFATPLLNVGRTKEAVGVILGMYAADAVLLVGLVLPPAFTHDRALSILVAHVSLGFLVCIPCTVVFLELSSTVSSAAPIVVPLVVKILLMCCGVLR